MVRSSGIAGEAAAGPRIQPRMFVQPLEICLFDSTPAVVSPTFNQTQAAAQILAT